MRKTLSVFLIFILLFSMIFSTAVTSYAVDYVNYTASSISGKSGDTVTVSVTISSDVSVWASNVSLKYNSSELQYLDSSFGNITDSLQGNLFHSGNSVNFSGIINQKSGTVFSVRFKILMNSGKSLLTLSSTENIDYNNIRYDCKTTDGFIYVSDNSFKYSVLSETSKTCKLTKYEGTESNVVIPTIINGYSVTEIGDNALSGKSVVSVIVPETVNSIGKNAFYNCVNLKSVSIPVTVISIGDFAFYNCNALKDVYYSGTKQEWNSIKIGQQNEKLTYAVIHWLLKPPATSVNGWYFDSVGWVYCENGIAVKNRWIKDSAGWCYVGTDGYCVTNGWAKDSIGWCYLDENGRMVANRWVLSDGKWYFIDSNGYMVSNVWKKDSKGWCYLGADGAMLVNSWVKDSVGWCYVGSDGYCVTNKWVKDSIGWCYLGSDGRMVTNKWVKDSVGWCYVGADGHCVTNEWAKDSKGWCYLDANGRMMRNSWLSYKGNWYYLDENGYMVTGYKKINGVVYKFASNGILVS